MTLSPTVLWAQTKEALYLTVELSKASDVKCDFTDDSVTFSASKDGKNYAFSFKFSKPVKSSEVQRFDERFIRFRVPKAESESWTSLNSCGKKHYIKCDWDRWVDSDAEDDLLNDGFNMPNFGDFGDLNDFGDMGAEEGDLEDSEEDEPDSCCATKSCGDSSCNTESCHTGSKCAESPCNADCSCGPNCDCGPDKKCSDKCTC
ncbi:hypothetical protein BEWA_022340 [Theileria equi strain WA]|uniref:CS domain-containing protein n=1 Tax=Theileria equi strain WA TaxID=1537102 RepID=L0AWJ5_THEEQ|nr:hypothetical protein BEWA_022340 [Theileria equi strain WA]AFZ79386.1 hypothetical protein BEWA_022340 [Theileria equi strain WA]|eukprot:XP_004829052.1 hypothetical protein BEWA_022340 [Theileria equi strain WA]